LYQGFLENSGFGLMILDLGEEWNTLLRPGTKIGFFPHATIVGAQSQIKNQKSKITNRNLSRPLPTF
jgi:hypothetical protein